MPTVPVKDAGWRIDPPVSVAVAPSARCEATAVEEPPEDPPGTRSASLSDAFQGLIQGPKRLVSLDEPIANSSLLSLPSITAPSAQRLAVTVDSYVGVKSSRMLLQAVVRTPSVQKRSLTPKGIPSSGPASPFSIRASDAAAILSATSGVSVT